MNNQIPIVIEALYNYYAREPHPSQWPEHIKDNPVLAHGLLAFYRGLQIGLQLGSACLEHP